MRHGLAHRRRHRRQARRPLRHRREEGARHRSRHPDPQGRQRAQRPLRRLLAAVRGPRRRGRRARAPNPVHEAQNGVGRRHHPQPHFTPVTHQRNAVGRGARRNAPPRASSAAALAATSRRPSRPHPPPPTTPSSRASSRTSRSTSSARSSATRTTRTPRHLRARARARLGLAALADSTTATTGPRPFAHRECLVCALCAYVLQGPQLPPTPTHSTLNGAELRARLESTSLPADAPAAMRAAHFRCYVEPLSFAVELCSKTSGRRSLPQHLACLETGRIQLQLQLGVRPPLGDARLLLARAAPRAAPPPPAAARPPPNRPRARVVAVRDRRRALASPPRARADTWASVKRRGARGAALPSCTKMPAQGRRQGAERGRARLAPPARRQPRRREPAACTSSSPRRPSPARPTRRAASSGGSRRPSSTRCTRSGRWN